MKMEDMIQGLRELHDAIEAGMDGDEDAINYLRDVLYLLVENGESHSILDMALHMYHRSLDYVESLAESN